VTKRSGPSVEAHLAKSAEALMGRKGFVTVAVIERQPIYVLGAVKNPGSYRYATGTTVLHAVALAGGLDRATLEPWQRIEAVRETGRRQGAIERSARLLARSAVLKAEQEGTNPEPPRRLIDLIGEDESRKLIGEQIERRRPVAWTRQSRENAARATVNNAREEIDALNERVQPIEESIKLRSERVDSMRSLMKSNVVANPMLVQAQSELAEVQERRHSALTAVALAKQRLALAEQEVSRLQAEAQAELERDLTNAEQELADGSRDLEASEGILKVIRTGAGKRDKPLHEGNVAYEVVRRSPSGAITIPSTGTTMLEPGDLVRVHQGNDAELRADEATLR